jgi:hypothetical protein
MGRQCPAWSSAVTVLAEDNVPCLTVLGMLSGMVIILGLRESQTPGVLSIHCTTSSHAASTSSSIPHHLSSSSSAPVHSPQNPLALC